MEASVIPSAMFYNSAIATSVDLVGEWKKFQSSDNTKVFNFFSYPYLIPVEAKYKVIRLQFDSLMSSQVMNDLIHMCTVIHYVLCDLCYEYLGPSPLQQIFGAQGGWQPRVSFT